MTGNETWVYPHEAPIPQPAHKWHKQEEEPLEVAKLANMPWKFMEIFF